MPTKPTQAPNRRHRLSPTQIAWARLLVANGMSHAEAAEKFGCSRRNIHYHVTNGKRIVPVGELERALIEAQRASVRGDWAFVAEQLHTAAEHAKRRADGQPKAA